jgi:hypothetical protein
MSVKYTTQPAKSQGVVFLPSHSDYLALPAPKDGHFCIEKIKAKKAKSLGAGKAK